MSRPVRECQGCRTDGGGLISAAHDWLCRYNPMRPESADDVVTIDEVTRFLARCDCGWKQLHRLRKDAEWDARRHAYEWHDIGHPALIGPELV